MKYLRYLLDTHTLLWLIKGDARLRPSIRDLLSTPNIHAYSLVSLWEISIKRSIGKLQVPNNLDARLRAMGFHPLTLSASHTHMVAQLPFHHRDPFDRMLVAQAMVENLTLITADARLKAYELAILDAG